MLGAASSRPSRLPDVGGILSRHRVLILGCILLTVLATVAATRRITPMYRAAAMLRIDERRKNLPALDILGQLSGTEISTEMEVLGSRSLAAAVADTLVLQLRMLGPRGVTRSQVFTQVRSLRGEPIDTTPVKSPSKPARIWDRVRSMVISPSGYRLEREPDGRYQLLDMKAHRQLGTIKPGDRIELNGVGAVFAPKGEQLDRYDFAVLQPREAASGVHDALVVARPVQLANIVRLEYEDPDPQIARDVPAVLAALYIAQRQRVASAQDESTVRFLRDQIAKLTPVLAAQEDSLRRFREVQQVVSLQEEARTGVERMAELRAQRNQLDAERSALAAVLNEVRGNNGHHDASRYRYLMAFPTLLKDQAATGLLASLNQAEDRRAELLTRRTPADPEVIALDKRIDELGEQLAGVVTTYYNGLANQVSALDATIQSSASKLNTIPSKEMELDRLERKPKVLQDLYSLLQTRLKEAEIAAAATDQTVRLIDTPELPTTPVRPKPALNIGLALAAGLLLGTAAAFVKERMDKNIHSRMDVEATTRLPVLGLIPRVGVPRGLGPLRAAARRIRRLAPGVAPNGARSNVSRGGGSETQASGGRPSTYTAEVSEAFNRLALNITFALPELSLSFAQPERVVKTIVVTSPAPGDGKTTVCANLALAVARRGRKVLLVDADVRRGRIHSILRCSREPGLTEVVSESIAFEAALRRASVGGGLSLDCLTSGKLQQPTTPVLGAEQIFGLLEQLQSAYDLVLVDTPPLNVVSDAAALGAAADGVILVARSGVTAIGALGFGMEQLVNARARVIGTVLNDIDFDRESRYDPTYRYYRYDASCYAEVEDGEGVAKG
jgi:capsular exopolysaccharide synthesis family protein